MDAEPDFHCYGPRGDFIATPSSDPAGWKVFRINWDRRVFVDWTDTREDAVRLARMHADMELLG